VPVLRALYQGLAYYKTHATQAIAVIAKATSEPTSEARSAYEASKALFTSSIVPSLPDQKNVLKALVSTQPAAKSFDAAKLLNASYAEQAEKK
jgi:ABC-type nitrate/sulfonate/bicarbonate transport system substrate-binding protein